MSDLGDDPARRVLDLLSALASQATWRGPALAQRLGVTTRTLRRDIERLRRLGYVVDATSGPTGGYRLVAGGALPPVFLDDDEAVAVVAALLLAIGEEGTGMVDASASALGKLRHLLPDRVLGTAAAVEDVARPVGPAVGGTGAPPVVPGAVATLAHACRSRTAVRFAYRRRDGVGSERRVEPLALRFVLGVWYLVAFDRGRSDWRMFRVDRMDEVVGTGHDAAGPAAPADGVAAFVARSLAATAYRWNAEVHVDVGVDRLLTAAPWLNPARVERRSAQRSVVRLGADDVGALRDHVARVVGLGLSSRIEADTDVVLAIEALADDLAGACRAARGAP